MEAYDLGERPEESEPTMRAKERVKRRAEDVCRILTRAKKICEEGDGP